MASINIQKKDLYLLAAIMVFLVGVGYVIAYNSGGPASVMGHSAEEIDGLYSSLSCHIVSHYATSASEVQCDYGTRTGGGCHSTSDWFLLENYPINPNGWRCRQRFADRQITAYAVCCKLS